MKSVQDHLTRLKFETIEFIWEIVSEVENFVSKDSVVILHLVKKSVLSLTSTQNVK